MYASLSFVPAKCWFDSRITQYHLIPVLKIQKVLPSRALFDCFVGTFVVGVVVGVEDKQPPPYGTDMG